MIYVESRIISQAGKSPQYDDHVIDCIRTWQGTRLKSLSDLLRRVLSDLLRRVLSDLLRRVLSDLLRRVLSDLLRRVLSDLLWRVPE